MNRRATGLSVRFFRVTIPTDTGADGSSTSGRPKAGPGGLLRPSAVASFASPSPRIELKPPRARLYQQASGATDPLSPKGTGARPADSPVSFPRKREFSTRRVGGFQDERDRFTRSLVGGSSFAWTRRIQDVSPSRTSIRFVISTALLAASSVSNRAATFLSFPQHVMGGKWPTQYRSLQVFTHTVQWPFERTRRQSGQKTSMPPLK
jgi:hypothetical protein